MSFFQAPGFWQYPFVFLSLIKKAVLFRTAFDCIQGLHIRRGSPDFHTGASLPVISSFSHPSRTSALLSSPAEANADGAFDIRRKLYYTSYIRGWNGWSLSDTSLSGAG